MNHSGSTARDAGAGTGGDDPLKGLRVLIVEDSFLAARSLEGMLREFGCEVIGPVSTVEAAIPLVDRASCDAAILDVNLAGRSSEPLAERLSRAHLPFLFVSGYASPALLSDAYRGHARVRKPVSDVVLRSAMMVEFGSAAGG